MDQARYLVAVLVLVTVPPAVALWYAIHPFARFWRGLGPRLSYLVLSVPAFALGSALWTWRVWLLGRNLGSHWWLVALAAAAAAAGGRIWSQRRRHLTQAILAGVPELSKADKGRLLTEGIYARIRNPRYIEFILFVLAYVAFANYAGTWILWVLQWPAIHAVVLLEERELRDRFGPEYVAYCQRVPRYLPRRR